MPSLSSTTTARILSMPIRSHEAVRALQILRVFAIVLNEAAHVLQHFVVLVDDAQHVALADVRARRAADVDFPLAAFDRDRAHVLHHRLGAVARASGGRELQLVRAVDALKFAARSSCASAMLSPTPKRQNSVPTQLLQVRYVLA